MKIKAFGTYHLNFSVKIITDEMKREEKIKKFVKMQSMRVCMYL